eukprot:475505-Rhodomonas_salina.1
MLDDDDCADCGDACGESSIPDGAACRGFCTNAPSPGSRSMMRRTVSRRRRRPASALSPALISSQRRSYCALSCSRSWFSPRRTWSDVLEQQRQRVEQQRDTPRLDHVHRAAQSDRRTQAAGTRHLDLRTGADRAQQRHTARERLAGTWEECQRTHSRVAHSATHAHKTAASPRIASVWR